MAKLVTVVERGSEASGCVADLLLGLDRAVGVEEEDVYRATVGTAVIVVVGADDNVVDAVVVNIANGANGATEVVKVVKRGTEAASGVADLLFGPDRAVGIQEQDMDGAAVAPAVIVPEGADGDVRETVAVEVTDTGDRYAETVVVVEGGRQAASAIADLLFGRDGPVGIQEQECRRRHGRSRHRRPCGRPRRCR